MLLSVAPRTLGRRRGAAPSSATARRIGLVGTVVPATIAAVAPPVSAARCESATTPPPPPTSASGLDLPDREVGALVDDLDRAVTQQLRILLECGKHRSLPPAACKSHAHPRAQQQCDPHDPGTMCRQPLRNLPGTYPGVRSARQGSTLSANSRYAKPLARPVNLSTGIVIALISPQSTKRACTCGARGDARAQ